MMVSGEKQQPYVKCFVEDCGYTSVWDEFSARTQIFLPPACFPVNVHYKLVMREKIRMELQRSFLAKAGREM